MEEVPVFREEQARGQQLLLAATRASCLGRWPEQRGRRGGGVELWP